MRERPVAQRPVGDQVAASIRRERVRRGLTLQDLADATEATGRPISVSMLSKIETRERRVDVDDLVALAKALRVGPNKLLFDVDGCNRVVADGPTTPHDWFSSTAPNTNAALAKLVRCVVEEVLAQRDTNGALTDEEGPTGRSENV